MQTKAFETSCTTLEETLFNTLAAFFEERDQVFLKDRFKGQASVDIAELAREAHFYGAEEFPDAE